jgi:hypothetical protein
MIPENQAKFSGERPDPKTTVTDFHEIELIKSLII